MLYVLYLGVCGSKEGLGDLAGGGDKELARCVCTMPYQSYHVKLKLNHISLGAIAVLLKTKSCHACGKSNSLSGPLKMGCREI